MYSRADRFLHRLTLGSPALLEATFDIERALWRRPMQAIRVERPLFVSGLARAGTSILTRLLHADGGFASPSWRDLPFPLSPNGWARIGGRRHVEAAERGHGDGLTHDLDSPEAIEEVFWRVREGHRYLTREGLEPIAPEPGSIAAFRDYVRLVLLRHGGGRYLSKNNNNVLRLGALCEAFPDAMLLHPFRDPLQQALSLLGQHRRALELARRDPFRARFMTWLGHYEFGADQRPFRFRDAPAPDMDRGHVDYWLGAWDSVHRALLLPLHEVRGNQLFLDYDALCADAARYVPRLAVLVGARLDPAALAPPAPRGAEADPALLAAARETHAALRERFRASFG